MPALAPHPRHRANGSHMQFSQGIGHAGGDFWGGNLNRAWGVTSVGSSHGGAAV